MPSTVPSVLKTFSWKTEFAKPARYLDAKSVLLKTIAQIVLTTTGPISSMESVFAGCLTKGPTIKESVGKNSARFNCWSFKESYHEIEDCTSEKRLKIDFTKTVPR